MSSLRFLTLGCLSVLPAVQAIPVPAPPVSTDASATAPLIVAPTTTSPSVATSAIGSASTAPAPPSTGLSVASKGVGANTTTIPEEPVAEAGPLSDAASSATESSASASASETSVTGISALNGMSTKQLAMYCGIGLAVFVAIGAGWFFFQKYQKKKNGETDDDDDDDSSNSKKKRTSDFDDSDDSEDESEDEKPVRSKKEKYTAPLPSAKLYPQPTYHPSANLAGTGAHGNRYENDLRHNGAMDIYPVDPSVAPARPPRTAPSSQHPREKSVQRNRPHIEGYDDSSDDSDDETEEEKKRRQRRDAKKKAKRST